MVPFVPSWEGVRWAGAAGGWVGVDGGSVGFTNADAALNERPGFPPTGVARHRQARVEPAPGNFLSKKSRANDVEEFVVLTRGTVSSVGGRARPASALLLPDLGKERVKKPFCASNDPILSEGFKSFAKDGVKRRMDEGNRRAINW